MVECEIVVVTRINRNNIRNTPSKFGALVRVSEETTLSDNQGASKVSHYKFIGFSLDLAEL